MPDPRSANRRTPSGRAREQARRPVARPGRSRTPRPEASGSADATGDAVRRPRLTGRAALLVLVLAVLAVSYASSLRAYLQQRGQLDDLQSQIAQRQASIDSLRAEKDQWNDPAYVQMRARMLQYVMPGETPYSVQQGGHDLSAQSSLGNPATIGQTEPPAWWTDAWTSIQVAGNPPQQASPVPPTQINGH